MALINRVLISILVLVFVLIPTVLVCFHTLVNHPNDGLNVIQLLDKFGYASETHKVLTEDGYILTLHRISQKKSSTTKKTPSTAVLLNHGMCSSSVDYITRGPGKSLGLLLADNNYDVWLGNYRGTTWSRNHTKLDPDKDEFWYFSLDEFGLYDLPASIDYILNKTGESQLNYIGSSQSGTVAMITLSERPEYLKKVKFASLLCPAVFMKNSQSPVLVLGSLFPNFVKNLMIWTGNIELGSAGGKFSSFFQLVCNDQNSFLFNICKFLAFLIQQDIGFIDLNSLPTLTSNFPAGISVFQAINLMQYSTSGEFIKYDWGTEENLIKYGQEKPPSYDLRKITTPIAIYYSKYDKLVNERDIKRLIKSLPNVVKENLINQDNFNHLDFIFGINVTEIVYNPLFEELQKYQ